MKKSFVAVMAMILLVGASALAAVAPYGRFEDGMLSRTRPAGWLAETCRMQAEGLGGQHFAHVAEGQGGPPRRRAHCRSRRADFSRFSALRFSRSATSARSGRRGRVCVVVSSATLGGRKAVSAALFFDLAFSQTRSCGKCLATGARILSEGVARGEA